MRATLKMFQQYSLYLRHCRQAGLTDQEMQDNGMKFDEFASEDIGEYFIGANGRVE